jgi:hypothetical protein
MVSTALDLFRPCFAPRARMAIPRSARPLPGECGRGEMGASLCIISTGWRARSCPINSSSPSGDMKRLTSCL